MNKYVVLVMIDTETLAYLKGVIYSENNANAVHGKF